LGKIRFKRSDKEYLPPLETTEYYNPNRKQKPNPLTRRVRAPNKRLETKPAKEVLEKVDHDLYRILSEFGLCREDPGRADPNVQRTVKQKHLREYITGCLRLRIMI